MRLHFQNHKRHFWHILVLYWGPLMDCEGFLCLSQRCASGFYGCHSVQLSATMSLKAIKCCWVPINVFLAECHKFVVMYPSDLHFQYVPGQPQARAWTLRTDFTMVQNSVHVTVWPWPQLTVVLTFFTSRPSHVLCDSIFLLYTIWLFFNILQERIKLKTNIFWREKSIWIAIYFSGPLYCEFLPRFLLKRL